MFEAIRSWLQMEVTKVDDVMHHFYDTIVKLERVAMAHAARAEEHMQEILHHTEEQAKSQAESMRATKLVAKLQDLLG